MNDRFTIRPASMADAGVLAFHRAAMFRDMGTLPANLFDAMVAATELRLAETMSAGTYYSWVASPGDEPDTVIGGAGFQLRTTFPSLRRLPGGAAEISTSAQALVRNVYTHPEWRRMGVARRLMQHVIAGARDRGAGSIVLHASPEGRPLYESMGFVPTNEMRYPEA